MFAFKASLVRFTLIELSRRARLARMLLIPGTGNGERGTGNGERGTGNGERGTGNGERGTGNREPGTGNGSLESSVQW